MTDLVKILKKLDAFVSKQKTQLYLPGIKQNLSYEEGAEIIRNEALSIVQVSQNNSADETQADLITSFDQVWVLLDQCKAILF